MSLFTRALTAALPLLALSACQTIYPVPNVEFPSATAPAMPASGPLAMAAYEPMAAPTPPPAAVTGSIYASAAYRPMFEDYRARHVGDTLTVRISEKVSATQSATSTVDKKASVDAGITALPGVKPNSFDLGRTAANANGTNKFEGSGTTENTNDFSGTITAIVTGVLPNGHLLIAGEKQIGVNHNVDVLRFTGHVDPRSILPGNTVQSAQIANVRIEHRGRGQMSDAQGIGWLARFFLNLLPV